MLFRTVVLATLLTGVNLLGEFPNINLYCVGAQDDVEFTHALVYFAEEDCTSVVPVSKLQSKNEDKYEVVWKRGQRYPATIIVIGKACLSSALYS